jgi:small subunit ribosomal protein S6
MLNQYETVFILTPVLSEAQAKEAVQKFRGVITDAGGSIIHEENWGLRKLAYPIQKKTTGFYFLIEFNAPSEMVAKLETEYRRDERVIRFLTIHMEKYAVEYSTKKKNMRATKEKTVEE